MVLSETERNSTLPWEERFPEIAEALGGTYEKDDYGNCCVNVLGKDSRLRIQALSRDLPTPVVKYCNKQGNLIETFGLGFFIPEEVAIDQENGRVVLRAKSSGYLRSLTIERGGKVEEGMEPLSQEP